MGKVETDTAFVMSHNEIYCTYVNRWVCHVHTYWHAQRNLINKTDNLTTNTDTLTTHQQY